MFDDIFCIILDYCGGIETNKLFQKLSRWNSNFTINVLDNASPRDKSGVITNQNIINSGVGGGIRDCINLARKSDSKYLIFIANDIIPITKIDFKHLVQIMKYNSDVVQVSVSLTKNSDKKYYPWMTNSGFQENRLVPHADLLCCLLDLDFLESFGGFPDSWSGWGYDWELGYQAKLQNKRIVICDMYRIKHSDNQSQNSWNQKLREVAKVYDKRYGNYRRIMPFGFYT